MAQTIIADFARYGTPIWPASGSCSIIGAGGGDTTSTCDPSRF
jgi:hypothetical protein